MKRWLFVHGIGLLSKKYSMLSEQAERFAFLAREFGVSYLDVLEEKNAQHRVQRIGLRVRISKWFGAIANR